MRQKIELVLSLLLLAGLIAASRNVSRMVSSEALDAENPMIVLDPGHGGADPGKVGVNDVEEKALNLAIAKKVEALLAKEKYDVVMTRDTDEMLGTEKSKVSDMKERVAKINQEKPILAVSIHQNSFHQEKERGAQVFYYSHSGEGKRAAELMQKALLTMDPENRRSAKANDTYYLLKRTEVPTIIVECGFLSNWEEAELLKEESYQEKLAQAIADGIQAYVEK